MVEAGALLIDVREINEFQQVRIPGSTFLPMSRLAERYEEIPTDKPVILYCRTGARSAQAVAALTHQAGYGNVHNMDGGIVEWYEEGLPVSTDAVDVPGYRPPFDEMASDLANKEIENGQIRWIVDVRTAAQWATGHLAGAVNIPFGQLPLRHHELPKGEPVLVACDRGEQSMLAARLLVDLGHQDVRTIAGGLEAWRYQSLPLVDEG
jgi:rhodanese-related sulfurtransferase